jgi:hypothetical protein
MTEQEIYAVIAKGQRAAELLENTTLLEALDTLEADAINRWRNSMSRDIDGREALYATMQGIEALRVSLSAWVEAAKHEAAKLEKQRARDEAKATRPRRFGVV